MNEETPAVSESNQGTATPAVPNSSRGTTVNYRKLRARADATVRPTIEPVFQPKIMDSSLEEDDLRVRIRVSAITRLEKLFEFKLERILYGTAQSQSLFQELDNLLQEIYESTAVRLNRKLQPKLEAEDCAPQPKTDAAEAPSKEPGARSPEDEEFDRMFAHLDRRSHQGHMRVKPGLRVPPLRDQMMDSQRNARRPSKQSDRQSSKVGD